MGSGRTRHSALVVLLLTGGMFLTGGFIAGCGGGGGEQRPKAQQERQAKGNPGQAHEEFIRRDFTEVDSDRNGTVDREESEAAMRADFKAMDLDRDGVVTLKDVQRELDATGRGKAGGSLSVHLPYDRDGDDEITEREYLVEVREEIHQPMDSNRNGEVSVEEAVAFHKKAGRERRGRR